MPSSNYKRKSNLELYKMQIPRGVGVVLLCRSLVRPHIDHGISVEHNTENKYNTQ